MVYDMDNRVVTKDPKLILDKTDAFSIHTLQTLLCTEDIEYAYIRCVDHELIHIEGNTVILKYC